MKSFIRLCAIVALESISFLAVTASPPKVDGGQKLAVPTGSWFNVTVRHPNGITISLRYTLILSSNGSARVREDLEAKAQLGRTFIGKFAGRTRVAFSQYINGHAARVGDDVYVYLGDKGEFHLISGDPTGYSLEDYQTWGGVSPNAWKGGEANVIVYKIRGDELVKTGGDPGTNYVLKRAK